MASSSSSQSWEYDVFLSFRGTDTRITFVDHLYSALEQQGIYTYKDDQTLPRGETIGPSLLKAIEESQIAVIVFSENYTDSSWCLQELAHIMKCKDERGQIVIPIFYHVDPSDLRNQKRKYGDAFAKHESKNKNVESWRKALVDAGNLSGYVPNGPERVFIKQIVDTISNRLCVPISSDDDDLIGIEARLQDLKSKMELMESECEVMVGIWGLGGGGKTTLASALYDEISTEFDACCFVKDVREESSKHGLPKLQKEILSHVLKQKIDEVVVDVGRLIKRRLRRKKVLMVLDDVDHLDQLKELAGSNAWFGKGSRIIITTRDNHLLTAHKVKVIYNVSLLNDDEAIKLFRKHAYREHEPVEDYEMLSKHVISYVGGLPLALKVLGSFLCDKNMSEWRSALARLKDVPDSDIVEKLKISYDGLKPMEKELFLDIACFFRGKEKDKTMVILDACGFHPIIGVKVLIEKALITLSQAGKFYMHDLIQEMGQYIVRGENPKNPELHSRVWEWKDVVKICGVHATKENDRIKALQVWSRRGTDIPHSLPQVIGDMKKLRLMVWPGYPATSFSREFQPTELCCLHLNNSLVEQLWEGYKHLPNLKVLDLGGSYYLVRTPDFNGLPCLERLILSHCSSLKEIHPTIGYHERLIFLDMEFCNSLEIFPPIVKMRKLETLKLSYCSKLCKSPEIQASMDNLFELSLSKTRIETVPSSVGQYCTNLISLDLTSCQHLQSIEGNFHLLKHLERLYLIGCDQLENVPIEGLFDVECCLQQLSLCLKFFNNLKRRAAMNELLGFPRFLTSLSLAYCELADEDISFDFCEACPNLQVLDLSSNYFSRLDSSFSQHPRLKYLNLSYCSGFAELPDLPSSIAIFIAYECRILDFVPTNNLKWLWKVSLSASYCLDEERVLQSMLQGNAIEDHFLSIRFKGTCNQIEGYTLGVFLLLLPLNWYNEFSGFLIYLEDLSVDNTVIIIKDVMGWENEDDLLEGSNEDEERERRYSSEDEAMERGMGRICYISFNSLRRTSWWNSTHTTISFFIKQDASLKVELVPRRSQGDDSIEREKDTTNSSEFWDEESSHRKTFKIIDDSRSSIKIKWCHDVYLEMSNF